MGYVQSIKKYIQSNDTVNPVVMSVYMKCVHPSAMRARAKRHGLRADFGVHSIDIIQGSKVIRCGKQHAIYAQGVIDTFEHYYSAVKPVRFMGMDLVDYSLPKYHDVVGFDLHPVFFPALAEPMVTTSQYLDFAGLADGAICFDLGAYSGLTSIMLREACGANGRVIAVDADAGNILAINKNLALYERLTGRHIELLEGAVWTHNEGISFSSEGNMGSSATNIVGNRLGAATLVPSFTLSAIADRYDLPKLDFIKCDIEGAEAVIFKDEAFFARYRPRILVEGHPVNGEMTTTPVTSDLARHGYQCVTVPQHGIDFPLLECSPE